MADSVIFPEQILGVDTPEPAPAPVVETPAEPPVAETPAPQQPPSNVRNIEEVEFLRLKEQSDLYEIIRNDPEVHSQVSDILNRRVNGRPASKPATSDTNGGASIEQLRQDNNEMRRLLQETVAGIQIRDFAASTPDFQQQRGKMAELCKRHPSLTLPEAYALAKGHAAPQASAPAAKAPLQTAETKSGGVPRETDELAAVQRRINDPKATPRTDDYIREALEAARKHHNSLSN